MDYCKYIASILHKAQGVVDPETKQAIDVGEECLALRQGCDALESRVRELEGERDRLREAIRVAGLDLWCGDTPSDEVVRKLSAALKG